MKKIVMLQTVMSMVSLILCMYTMYGYGIGLDEQYTLQQFADKGNIYIVWILMALSFLSCCLGAVSYTHLTLPTNREV